MSNIQTTIDFLRDNPEKHFINITQIDNGKPLGATKIFLRDIANEDLKNYIKYQLGPISKPTMVYIELRKSNGSSSSKEKAFGVEVNPDVMTQNNKIPAVAENVHNAVPLGNPLQIGLGLAEYIEATTDAKLLKEITRQYEKLEKAFDDLKHENRKLELDLRAALTDVSKAEAKETLAVMMARMENRSFFESEGFSKMMEKAPEVLASIAAMKTGHLPAEASMLGNPDLSDTQKEFINYVIENLNDNQIVFLGSIIRHMNNVNFVNSISQLTSQYNEAS